MTSWTHLTEKQLRERWRKAFRGKMCDLGDIWYLQCVSTQPRSNTWEELSEHLNVLFKCKECEWVWLSPEAVVSFFFRRSGPYGSNEFHGHVLTWIQSKACPSCSSVNIPEMDVSLSEMEAVLTYLKMKIGQRYYDTQFTHDDELEVEQLRKSKKKKKRNSRQAGTVTQKQSGPNDSQVTQADKLQVERLENPEKKKKLKPKQAGKCMQKQSGPNETEQFAESLDMSANNTTEKSFWNQWYPLFQDVFQQSEIVPSSVTLSFHLESQGTTWSGSLHPERNGTIDQLANELASNLQISKKKNSVKERKVSLPGKATFKCSTGRCRNNWSSMKALARFTIRLSCSGSPPNGVIAIHLNLYGQKCKATRCARTANFEPAKWYPEEMKRVLHIVEQIIGNMLYGRKPKEGGSQRSGNPKSPHITELCEACQSGECTENRE